MFAKKLYFIFIFNAFLMQLTKRQCIFLVTVQMRSKSFKFDKLILKNFQVTSLKEIFQIKQQSRKISKKYCEEGTKRMYNKSI